MTPKFSAALAAYGPWPDRYCPEGYRDEMRIQERLDERSEAALVFIADDVFLQRNHLFQFLAWIG